MTRTPTLLTVVLNYRTADMTLDAVKAALAEMHGILGELVVVDNDSQDGSFEKMRDVLATADWANTHSVRVIQSGRNGGFGAGNNVGIQAGFSDETVPDYVYILNSDAFPHDGAIRKLLSYLETNSDVGFAGSYIHGPDGDPHITAFRFPSFLSEFEGAARFGPISRVLKNKIVPLPLPDATQPVDWLAGASMMMRRKVFDDIGLFDEAYFLYFEETDLCLRAARAGWPTHYVRDSHVTHIGSVSTGMKTWKKMPTYWFDSRLYYFTRNHGAGYAVLATLAHATGGALWRLRRLIQRKPPADPPQFLRSLLMHHARHILRGAKRPDIPRLTPPAAAAKEISDV